MPEGSATRGVRVLLGTRGAPGCSLGSGVPWDRVSLSTGCPRASPGVGCHWGPGALGCPLGLGVAEDWVPRECSPGSGVPGDWVPLGTGCPRVSPGSGCPQGGWPGSGARRALTVVELVAGLLLGAVARDPVDLHPHEGVHDGAALLLLQLGQLLRRDHLGDTGGTWVGVGAGLALPGDGTRVAQGSVWRWGAEEGGGWCHLGEGTWLIPAGSGDRVGVTQQKRHEWHVPRPRDRIGTIQKKG